MPTEPPNCDAASLDAMLNLLERLADSIANSVGYGINYVELAMEGAEHSQRLSQAKMLADRGIQELRLFLFLANFLRPFTNPSQGSAQAPPLPLAVNERQADYSYKENRPVCRSDRTALWTGDETRRADITYAPKAPGTS